MAAKIGHFLLEPNQLSRGVRDDAEFLRNELEGMSAFLRVGEEMENREAQIRNLLQQNGQLVREDPDVQLRCSTGGFKLYLIKHNTASSRRRCSAAGGIGSSWHGNAKKVADWVACSRRFIFQSLLCGRNGRAW